MVAYSWSPLRQWLVLVPWGMILACFLLRANRRFQALWIGVPLLVAVGFPWFLPALLSASDEGFAMFAQILVAVGYSQTVLWLLAPYLRCRNRLLTFLSMSGVALVGGLIMLMIKGDLYLWSGESIQTTVVAVLPVLNIMLMLGLTGWCCRRRYSRWRVVIGLAGWAVFSATLLVTVLFLIGTSFDTVSWELLPRVAFAIAGASIGLMLPFLFLLFLNPFYHDRLKLLMHITPPGSVAGQQACDNQ